MLEDVTSAGIPLLVLMSSTGMDKHTSNEQSVLCCYTFILIFYSKDTKFMKGLERFQTRVLYSNVQNDMQVPYCTAAIVHKNPYLIGK